MKIKQIKLELKMKERFLQKDKILCPLLFMILHKFFVSFLRSITCKIRANVFVALFLFPVVSYCAIDSVGHFDDDVDVYDICVVGGGISGVATAELFARNKYKVVLMEQDSKIASRSSAEQQGWFHTGYLYAHKPNIPPTDFIENMKTMVKYYSHFPDMNLRLNNAGHVEYVSSNNPWFENTVYFHIEKPSQNKQSQNKQSNMSFDTSLKRLIDYGIKLFGEETNKLEDIEFPQENRYFDEFYSFKRLATSDAIMNTRKILADLLKSFFDHQGNLLLNSKCTTYIKNGDLIYVINDQQKVVKCKHLIFASGSDIQHRDNQSLINTRYSPILVVYPKLYDYNFVSISDIRKNQITHLLHSVDGKQYSFIANGSSIDTKDANDENKMNSMVNNLKETAQRYFPDLTTHSHKIYMMGLKTEAAKAKKRNYSSYIKEIDSNIYVALPGKFTLSFNMAFNLFQLIAKHEPKQTEDTPFQITEDNLQPVFEKIAPTISDTMAENLIQ